MTTKISDIFANSDSLLNQELTVSGWVRTVRDSKGVGFIELNDGSQFLGLQIVLAPGELSDGPGYDEAVRLPTGSAISVRGCLVPSPGKQAFELKAAQITILGLAASDYPLQKKRHGFEFLRTIAHLRPRTNTFHAVFRMRSIISFAIHEFFINRGFVYIHTPILTGNDCEGGSDLFGVTTLPANVAHVDKDGKPDFSNDFFGRQAFLSVSGQLAVEPFALALRDVYTFGPIFRSEPSNTTTHAAEFWMIEPEMAFAGLDDVIRISEDLLKHVISACLRLAPDEMAFFDKWVEPGVLQKAQSLLEKKFERVSYTKVVELLQLSGRSFAHGHPKWGMDLQTEHERYIAEEVVGGPVFITDYPRQNKSFYMRVNDDEKTVGATDLIVPHAGEIIGGSEREERADVLRDSIIRMGLNPDDYAWYLDLRRFGTAKHAGFGLGLERLVMYITGMKNIRDVCAYPRTPGQMAF